MRIPCVASVPPVEVPMQISFSVEMPPTSVGCATSPSPFKAADVAGNVIGSSSRWWLNQDAHSRLVSSMAFLVFLRAYGGVSVLYNQLIVSTSALS